jgi:potassium efflux system protein
MIVFCLAVATCTHAAEGLTGDFSNRASIDKRLQLVQSELQQHAQDTNHQTHQLLKQLETTIYHHLAAIDFLTVKERQREQMAERLRTWSGFDQPPPYSVMFSDDLRTKLMSLQHLQRASQSRIGIITQILKDSVDQLDSFERAERHMTEMAELEDNVESRQAILISLQQNNISTRTEVEKVAYLELRLRGVQAELATYQARQSLIKLQLKSIEGQITFSQSELDKILTRISDERKQALDTLEAPTGDSQEINARVAWLAEFLDTEERFWIARFKALSTQSPTEREKILQSYKAMSELVDAWAEVGKILTSEQLLVTAQSTEEKEIQDKIQRVNRLKNHIDFAISELEVEAILSITLLERTTKAALAIWGTELYLVEDTTSIEGKRVTSYRAITLGKLIRLAFILTAGWFAFKFLSRRVRKLVSQRPGSSVATANTVSRWTFAIGLGLLTIYALKLVRIPFTAFAFLGGTLAIGIGFGAQTLLKNFISGVILILERPFKVGDYIEVDNVSGQIMRIGMRVSVIEHLDGIETLVPNSFLLDNRVDNWTFGKTAIRGSVEVGVAYRSSTREVSRALLSVANKHGQVHDRPEPEVRFENFGDNAKIFKLLFWVDPSKTQRERLASDLRFMIDKVLNEAGITISFPQRDIHFDSGQPLQVEVSSPSEERPMTKS